MKRSTFIERTIRQIYGGQPPDDVDITPNLVNTWMNDAIGLAARANYTDSYKMDGVGYVNNGFYTQFKNIAVTAEEQFTYKFTLPEIPLGIGANQGISTLQFIDSDGNVSLPCIPMSANQVSFFQRMRPVPNKVLFYPEGNSVYAKTTLLLDQYTAKVRMISGGDSTDLDSELNVPPDYFGYMVEYITKQLMLQRNMVTEQANDGVETK